MKQQYKIDVVVGGNPPRVAMIIRSQGKSTPIELESAQVDNLILSLRQAQAIVRPRQNAN
jgi:hypothetical protein